MSWICLSSCVPLISPPAAKLRSGEHWLLHSGTRRSFTCCTCGPAAARRNALGTTSADDPFLVRLAEFISSSNPEGVAVTPVVLTGDPVKAVAEYARVKSADLVVVGQNGRRGSRFWSSGVLATDVARAVASPTLTVSKEAVADTDVTASFNNILCGIDFSAASLRALNEALTMAQQSGGRVTLLHVLEGFPYESVYSGSRAFRLIDGVPCTRRQGQARASSARATGRAELVRGGNGSRLGYPARRHPCHCDCAKGRSRGDWAPAANEARSNRDGIDGLRRTPSCSVPRVGGARTVRGHRRGFESDRC